MKEKVISEKNYLNTHDLIFYSLACVSFFILGLIMEFKAEMWCFKLRNKYIVALMSYLTLSYGFIQTKCRKA